MNKHIIIALFFIIFSAYGMESSKPSKHGSDTAEINKRPLKKRILQQQPVDTQITTQTQPVSETHVLATIRRKCEAKIKDLQNKSDNTK